MIDARLRGSWLCFFLANDRFARRFPRLGSNIAILNFGPSQFQGLPLLITFG